MKNPESDFEAKRDPLVPAHAEFDYDSVARGLGEMIPPDRDEVLQTVGQELLTFFQRVIGPEPLTPGLKKKIAARVIAEALRMFPEWAGNHPAVKKLLPELPLS